MRNPRIFMLSLAFCLAISACDDRSAQDAFEREANQAATGISRTDATGRVIQSDPDDWRIAPFFQGFLEIQAVPYPNPSTGGRFTMELWITGVDAVQGLEIYTPHSTQPGTLLFVYEEPTVPLQTGVLTVEIEPSSLSPLRDYATARGLHRILVFDRNGNLITYGDLQVD